MITIISNFQNTALRIARLFEALKPILSSSSTFKSKKRDTELDVNNPHESKTKSVVEEEKNSAVETPVRNSYVALTQ